MTSIRQIVTDAYREAAIIAIEDTLDDDKFTEGLRRFNVLFNSLFEAELGEPLTTINYGTDGLSNPYAITADASEAVDNFYLPSNYRLILNIANPVSIDLPPNPHDGARIAIIDNEGNLSTNNVTLNGNGRRIENAASVVLDQDLEAKQWFYRADMGNWVAVGDFEDGDDSPFPEEFDDFLIMMLAIRIGPRHGATTSEEMVEALKRSRRGFRNRYRQIAEQDSEIGLYRLPSNRWYWKNTADGF